MCFSGLLILAFHLWVVMFRGNPIEQFLIRTAYIGVDMFFFLSAYSLASRKITDVIDYYGSRLEAVYLKFVFFCLVAAVVADWGMDHLWKSIFGIELFQKGGGAFLWFLPAIMLFYLIFPWMQRIFAGKAWLGATIVLLVWLCIGLYVTYTTDYTAMFIFWNRIPVFVVGTIAAAYEKQFCTLFQGNRGVLYRVLCGIVFLGIGIWLLYQFGFRSRLSTPLPDFYYVTAIPAVLGLILLLDLIPDVAVISLIGQATLELYALQMIFGFTFANKLYKATKNAALTNLCSIVVITTVAVLCSTRYRKVRMRLKK